MENEVSVMQTEALHPTSPVSLIHYYPTELLQCIFEMAVQAKKDGVKTATAISHVCQRWRSISLNTPRLWTYITWSITRDGPLIKDFWDRMRDRIKSLSPMVSIHDIGSSDSIQLDYLRLDHFERIERLNLYLQDAKAVGLFLNGLSDFPHTHVNTLQLTFEDLSRDQFWSLDYMIRRFSPQQLLIYNCPTFFLSFSPIWDLIQSLTLHQVGRLDPVITLKYFPGLTNLEIIETSIVLSDSLATLSSNTVRRMKLQKVQETPEWLEHITFPNLVTFEVDDHIDPERIISFLLRHSSVTTLHSTHWESINELAKAAPQLLHLSLSHPSIITYYAVFIDPKVDPGLPSLRSLTIRDTHGAVGVESFDNLIRARCLPSNHPQSLLPSSIKPLESLIIQILSHLMPENTRWGRSEFYKAAKCRVWREEEDPVVISFELSWVFAAVNGGNSIWLNADAHYSCQSLETVNTSAPQSSTSFMHPISRSPTDILQCIFEIGTQKSQEGFKFATSISHVCQRWRSVVLDNQQLWTYIECSMKKKESSILSFWDRMRRRNKGLPVIIVIQHIGQENSKPLKYCSLDEFPLIERLTFHLSDTESISEIQNLSFAVPVDRIERLELRFLQAMRSYGDWSWRALVGRFHNVKELHLRNAPRIHIERNGDDPTSLAPLPQLESLELVSTELWIPDPLSLRNLRRLNLRGNHRADSWLHQISCPNLTALDVDDDIRHERIMSFLSRHTHITSLHISSWEALGDIATVLPQVQHLTFRDPQMRLEHIPLLEPKSGAYLPALQSLTTWDWQGSLRPHEFEELVRGRCLPSSHPRSLLPIWMKPLKSFIIYHVASLSPDRIPWKRSKFFTEAKCIIEHDEEERIYYILSWI